jgi:hypothetical protein
MLKVSEILEIQNFLIKCKFNNGDVKTLNH